MCMAAVFGGRAIFCLPLLARAKTHSKRRHDGRNAAWPYCCMVLCKVFKELMGSSIQAINFRNAPR